MVDLHLFLPRPLQNEYRDPSGSLPPPGTQPPNSEVFYGNIPQQELDTFTETARALVDASQDAVRSCV